MTFKLTDAYKKAPYLFSHEFILKYNISPPHISEINHYFYVAINEYVRLQ